MDVKALKQKILDLAIHGKLLPLEKVEKIRKEEPASVLLEKIRAEKQEKIAKGELKRNKKDSFIFLGDDKRHYEQFADGTVKDIEDEIPFAVPEGWAWCRLKEVCELKGGKRIPAGLSATKEKTNHIYIRVTDMQNNSISDADLVYITDDIFEKIQRYTINKDDLYLTIAGTIGRVGEVPEIFDGMNLTENALKLTNISICKKYLMQILNTKLVQDYFESTYHQVAMPKLSLINASKTIIPVPPLDEQQKIVNEIDNVFSITNNLDIDIVDLEDLITRTKSKILDLAIHGKLVPQDPNDESASVLLEKIRAEKEEKIARGELKRDKNDSFIFKSATDNCHYQKNADGSITNIEDEIPFELPDGWSWCRLPNLCSIPITDGTHKTPTYSDKENGIPFLSSKDVTSGKIDWSKIKYITNDLHEELYNRIAPKKNDILLAKNGTTGVGAIVEDDTIFDIYVTLAVIRPILKVINPKYLLYVINSQFCKNQFNEHLTGIGVPNLHLVDINKTLIPLPPLTEQHRIVVRIEELFKCLDNIQNNL